jgi:hypothetical protein
VKFFFQPIYTDYANWAYFDKRSHLNLLLWNCWTKLNQTWQGWSQGLISSKMRQKSLKQQWTIKISSLLFSIFSLVAILVGSRDHHTQF